MKINKWMLGVGAVVFASLCTLTFVDVQRYLAAPKRTPADITNLECIRSGDQLLGFRGGAMEIMVRHYPSLDKVRSLVFTNVRLVDGDIRFITGGYRENSQGFGFREDYAYGFDPYYGFGSYGSYASNGEADPDDMGSGLARLQGGAHFEIKAQGGKLIKFRGAPLSSTQLFFQGRWERPGEDPAFTERIQAFLEIAATVQSQCTH